MPLPDPNQHEIYFGQHHYEDLNPLNCGYHICPPGHVARGLRPFYMIHYVDEGCGYLLDGNRRITLSKGQIFIIRPYEDLQYVADELNPWQYTYKCFAGNKAKRLDTLDVRVSEMSAVPFARLRELEERKDTREEMALSALYQIFAELFSGKSRQPHYVRRTVNMIHASYHSDQLSVARIADELSLDRRYLVRMFKEKTGMGIQEYIIKVRMDNAQTLLKNGFSVSTTASMVGYRDSFNFSKMFKKTTGLSPKHYSQAHRKGGDLPHRTDG